MQRIDNTNSSSNQYNSELIPLQNSGDNIQNNSVFEYEDKNNNGIVDRDDFYENDLEKIESNGLFRLFKNRKWTEQISKILTSILKNVTYKENNGIIKADLNGQELNKQIVYDSNKRELVYASYNGSPEYYEVGSYTYNEKGDPTREKLTRTDKRYIKNGHKYSVGHRAINWLAEKLGFKQLQQNEWNSEDSQKYENIFVNNENVVWDTTHNTYDTEGNLIENTEDLSDDEQRTVMHTENGITITTIYDLEGNLISQEKTDEDGNLIKD